MRIQRLYIGDFGIFRNQVLEPLSPGLVVIGGLNRAGKTTLLQILRYLGYGIPKVDSLPTAATRYEIESDVVLDSGDRFCIRVQGHGEPQVSCLTGTKAISGCRELYNDLDPFTYSQLFTISLDELQRIQRVRNNQELEKLQSIMLGAGLSDMIGIPQMAEEFFKLADAIGGTKGRVDVRGFKNSYNAIKEGLELRDEAIGQIELFENVSQELEEINTRIREAETKIGRLENELHRLDVLKNNFEDYSRMKSLEVHLDAPGVHGLIQEFEDIPIKSAIDLRVQYVQVLEEYDKQVMIFGRSISRDDIPDSANRLLEHAAELEAFKYRLSGLRERADNYVKQHRAHVSEERNISLELEKINKSWDGRFERVLEIECDSLHLDEITQHVSAYQRIQGSLEEYEREVARLSSEKAHIESELAENKQVFESASLRRYFLLSLLFVLGGVGLSFVSFWFAVVTASIGVFGSAVYVFVKFSIGGVVRERRANLEMQLKSVSRQVENAQKEMDGLKADFLLLEEKLEYYRDVLQLEPDVSPDMIREYFRDVQRLKQAILRWMEVGKDLEGDRQLIEKKLRSLADLLLLLQGIISVQIEDGRLLEQREELFGLLEESVRLLDLAKALKSVEMGKKDLEQKIREFIQCEGDEELLIRLDQFIQRGQHAERLKEMKDEHEGLKRRIIQSLNIDVIRRAFSDTSNDINDASGDTLLDAFSRLYEGFSSRDTVRQRYDECKVNLASLRRQLDELKDKRSSLSDEKKRLATTDKLDDAQRKIDKARAELRPLAEKYAVYRTANYILGKVHKRFMENTKHTLLKDASDALSRITRGEYVQILPPDNLGEVDFKTVLTDGRKQDTVDILSRGTREQLFLSIRLSRIREIQPPLPVIMDDSFVNFDRYHLEQALGILGELAETHQIFLLTCHPHLVDGICRNGYDAQFWRLERGKFNNTSGEELIRYLEACGH